MDVFSTLDGQGFVWDSDKAASNALRHGVRFEDAMKMTDRIKRNMQPDKPMTLISLRLPDHVIEDLKEVATSLGFGGYQALIRAYISNGLRKHLAEMEAQRAKDSTVEEFSRRLMAHGVPEQAIQDAVAEMRAGS